MKESVELIIKTENGKRLIFLPDGTPIKGVAMTRELQDSDLSNAGICELLVKLIVKCE